MTSDGARSNDGREKSGAAPPRPDFMVLLGVFPPYSADDVKQAYLLKVRDAHPDRGGNPDDFLKLQEAFERANEYVDFRANRMRWLGGQVERYARQEAMLERLRELGVRPDIERTDWLNRSFGEDFAQVADRVVGLDASGVGDVLAVAEALEEYRDQAATVRWLDLSGTSCGDEELYRFGFLSQLAAIDLRKTAVTSEGLEVAAALPALRWINVAGLPLSAWQRMKLGWKFRQLTLSVDSEARARTALAAT